MRWLAKPLLSCCLGAGTSIVGILLMFGTLRENAFSLDEPVHPHFSKFMVTAPFAETSRQLDCHMQNRTRMLLYTWCANSSLLEHGKVNGANPKIYWNTCWSQSRGFDLAFSQACSIKRSIGNPEVADDIFWMMVKDVQTHLSTGEYDYVLVMRDLVILNGISADPSVWAVSVDHDITIMDQNETSKHFELKNILFKASDESKSFLRELFWYQRTAGSHVRSGESAFLEMMLTSIGREADAGGDSAYPNTCLKHACLEKWTQVMMKRDPIAYGEKLAAHSACFFSQLKQLAGPYAYRKSKSIGFVTGDVWCLNLFQTLPLRRDECFVFPDQSSSISTRTVLDCPIPGFPWTHYYGAKDLLWFRDWSQRSHYSAPPRVLIYTWATENSFKMFANEAHWKACYAHAHGYEIVFTDAFNVTGVKQWTQAGSDFSQSWYSDDKMWAWNSDIRRFLFSGKYDYVFHVGADVLFHYLHIDFPIWAYDTGHDITVMDQDFINYGFNQNAVLFKPTAFAKKFLDSHYAYRKDFWTQGDNGPWMENILVYLGAEQELAGHRGYEKRCEEHGILSMPSGVLLRVNNTLSVENGSRYCKCFFDEFDRIGGPFGKRGSRFIGFSQTSMKIAGEETLPGDTDVLSKVRVMPWANCFSHVRDHWKQPERHCFAFHWNGAKKATQEAEVVGTCPDPSFDWKTSPWNFKNRKNRRK